MTVHPLVSRAAEGLLPDWAEAGEVRRRHMSRVAQLLGSWAEALQLPDEDVIRWRAVAYLHDALRDADPEHLRPRVPPEASKLPGAILHGPAAAERIRVDGVLDGELLTAIAWHTLGDPGFHRLGRALYAADFLEPGRKYLPEWREELRGRMPSELDAVAREVARARITRGLERGVPLSQRTAAFWNSLVGDRP